MPVFHSRWRFLRKHGLAMLVDWVSVVLAMYAALFLRFVGDMPLPWMVRSRPSVAAVAVVFVLFNVLFGLYGRIWQYASAEEALAIVESVAASTVVVAGLDLVWSARRLLPLSVVAIGGVLSLLAFVASRFRDRFLSAVLRTWGNRKGAASGDRLVRVLIIGAGEAGQLLVWRLLNPEQGATYRVVGFVDDDPAKHGLSVHGIKVLGGRELIEEIVERERVELIVVGIHTISGEDMQALLNICQTTPARIKLLPNVLESLETLSDAALLRDLTIEDLVGRERVHIDRRQCEQLIADKVILVTGAAGTIGSELCRQVVPLGPKHLVMVDNNETGLYELGLSLSAYLRRVSTVPALSGLHYVVADVTDRERVPQLFHEYRPEIVLHAAAYKHVPLMERYPQEAVRVNVGGTLNVLRCAQQFGCERMVLVSTDKAVDPVSVMGATKRLGELMMAGANDEGHLVATAVRFGNVLGSRGSVVPTFEHQIEMGGPLTVTSPNVTRFFMSVDEAAILLLQAASMATGGEIFILEMGQPIRIVDLAQKMIRLRGLRVGEDIEIAFSGLRPGEKLEESLVGATEVRLPTSHPNIFAVRPSRAPEWPEVGRSVLELLEGLENQSGEGSLREALWQAVGASKVARCDGLPGESRHPPEKDTPSTGGDSR